MRQRIVDAARHRFARCGYDAASLREIAAAAGVTKPMVYYYFGSKEGLYRALLEQTLGTLRQALAEATRPTGQGATQRLVALARLHQRLATQRSDDLRLLATATLGLPGAGPRLDICAELAGLHHRVIAAILQDGIAAGELRSADPELTTLIVGSVTSLFYTAAFHDRALPQPPDAAQRIVDILVDGIAAPSRKGTPS